MAYVNVAEWKPEQVTEWLKGLDNAVLSYIHSFLNNEVSGQQLLNLRPDDLDHLGVHKLGHQELILEAVEHLRNFHYELDRENLQLLALRLSCRAHSLHNELCHQTDSRPVSTQTLADVANVITAVKPLVCWLDRSPFTGQLDYQDRKSELLKLSLAIATCAMRDRFAERPVEEIRTSCAKLAQLADSIIQDIVDPLILQPASLDLATLKKRAGDDLGFFIVPSFHGVHQIGDIKFSSPAHQCGKIEEGDEVVQVNYQTVVGWQTKRVMALFEESPTDVFLTLKKRPRHTKVYGQIYMKPYRLPSKKRAAAPYSRWHDNLPSPRPELLTIPDFEMPLPRATPKQMAPQPVLEIEPLASISSSDDDDDESFLPGVPDEGQTSPTSMRLYLPKPRVTVQRRATVTGASPTNKRPPVNIEQFWRELRLERQWKDNSPSGGESFEGKKDDLYQLRDKSASFGNDLSISPPVRPTTCLGIENSCLRMKSGKKQEKKLRIIESRNEDCSEFPSDSMESVKENTLNDKPEQEEVQSSGKQLGESKFKENNDIQKHSDLEDKEVLHRNCTGTAYNKGDSEVSTTEDDQTQDSTSCFSTCKSIKPEFCDKERTVECKLENSVITPHVMQYGEVKSDVESGSEETILRVKGGGYNLPTDDITGMVEEVNDPCVRKSISETAVHPHKERGRLDKSYSTPAYDLSDCDHVLDRSHKMCHLEEQIDCHISDSDSTMQSPSEHSTHSVFQLDKQNDLLVDSVERSESSQFANTNFQYIDADTQSDLYSLEDKQTQRIGEILETINIALLQHRLKEHSNVGKKPSNGKMDLVSQKIEEPDQARNIAQHSVDGYKNSDLIQLEGTPHSETIDSKNENTVIGLYQEPDLSNQKTPEVLRGIKPQCTEEKLHRYPNEPVPHCSPPTPPDRSDVKICITPPEPPPRPPSSFDHPKGGTGVGYRAILAARSLGRNTSSKNLLGSATLPSPRCLRKRNPLLAKKRNVSVRDLGTGDCEGWLFHRCRSGGAGAVWLRAWFILKGTVFYGFKMPQSAKADIMISLPGFTASLAEEVKSRKYAFKVYHTGTVFYFAAETENELTMWLENMTLATLKQEYKPGQDSDAVFFSETDEESEIDMETETCFPSPKMRKFAGFLGSNSSHQDKQSSKSQQNIGTEPKSQDAQKKFGSLRKLGRKTNESSSSSTNPEMPVSSPAASSLDRKYLRFLGGSRNNIVPVPTAQFRSYRRVPNGPPPVPQNLPSQHNKVISDVYGQRQEKVISQLTGTTAESQEIISSAELTLSRNESCHKLSKLTSKTPETNVPHNGHMYQSAECVSVMNKENQDQGQSLNDVRSIRMAQGASTNVRGERIFKPLVPHPVQRHLKVDFRDRQMHSSNPSLQLPSEMADYRQTAERLREFGIRRNRQREDTSGFVTLEEFMLSRQEEERRQNIRAGNNEAYTGYTEDPLSMTESSGTSRNNSWSSNKTRNGGPSVVRRGSFNNLRIRRTNSSDQESRNREYRGDSPEKLWINSLRRNDETTRKTQGSNKNLVSDRSSNNASWSTSRLKAAAQYQPPPVSQSMTGSRNVHPSDEGPRMKLAFELHLDENKNSPTSDKDKESQSSKPSKFRNLFSSKTQHQKQNLLELPSGQNTQQKTLLGSPRLHRAIFRDKRHHGPKSSSASDSSSGSLSSPVSLPSSATAYDLSPDEHGSQSDPSMAQFKPTMGISMIGKKPSRRILSSSPSPASPPPDYPGLEYPPVFEPETYTLSDASTLLRSRQQSHDHSNAHNAQKPKQS